MSNFEPCEVKLIAVTLSVNLTQPYVCIPIIERKNMKIFFKKNFFIDTERLIINNGTLTYCNKFL